MLGMMNVPSDSVDFYAVNNDRKFTSQVSEEQIQAFTEVKHRPEITYTPDGRRLIDGKAEQEVDGVQLWHNMIKQRALNPVFQIPGVSDEMVKVMETAETLKVTKPEPLVASPSSSPPQSSDSGPLPPPTDNH